MAWNDVKAFGWFCFGFTCGILCCTAVLFGAILVLI